MDIMELKHWGAKNVFLCVWICFQIIKNDSTSLGSFFHWFFEHELQNEQPRIVLSLQNANFVFKQKNKLIGKYYFAPSKNEFISTWVVSANVNSSQKFEQFGNFYWQ